MRTTLKVSTETKAIVKALNTLNNSTAKVSAFVTSSLLEKQESKLIEVLNYIYSISKNKGKSQRINTLSKAIKKISSSTDTLTPLKPKFDRKLQKYTLVEYVSTSKQLSTFEQIVKLLSKDTCDINKAQAQKLAQILGKLK